MMRRFRVVLLVGPILAIIAVGCETMFDRSSGSSASETLSSAGPSTTTTNEGAFVDVGPDIVDVRPELIELDEEGEATFSNFRAIQIDSVREDSAGPKFAKIFDIDNDGLLDVLTAWNQSQPVQAHLQRRSVDGEINFIGVNLGGTSPLALIGGIDMADFDGDGWLDVVVLAKTTGGAGICPTPGGAQTFEVLGNADDSEIQLLFSPGNFDDITNGDAWQLIRLDRSNLPGRRDEDIFTARTFPEFNSLSGVVAGEIDGINGADIVVMFNPATCEFYGDDPPVNRLQLYANPGGDNTRNPGTIQLTATADAGQDQAVAIPDPTATSPVGTAVTLNGAASFTSFFGTPSFFWEQVSGPTVSLAGSGSATPIFTAPITSAALSFRLTASAGSSDFDYVNVVVGDPGNNPPFVTASNDRNVMPDVVNPSSVVINMTAGGFDPDGDALTYQWDQVFGPPVSLSGETTPFASFSPPAQGGELQFRVTVSDGTYFASDLVVIVSGQWAPILLDVSLARAGDVSLSDVDGDGDNDIVYTFPNQVSSNTNWARNPAFPHTVGGPSGSVAAQDPANWELRPIGQVDTEANVIQIGDVDLDGFDDVLVRSSIGRIVQWFRHPGASDLNPIFPPSVTPGRFNFPWQVYSVAEFDFRIPAAIAVGDLTGDGLNEVVAAAGGVVYWYDASTGGNPYDTWEENFVIDDTKSEGVTDDPSDPDFQDNGSVINWLTVADMDGDGFGDVIGVIDRRTLSGLNDDTLIWFRNTLGDQVDSGM